MRLIIIATLFLIPLIGLASFPIINETTEIINQAYLTPWYNTWWAILLQIILFPIGLVRLLYWAATTPDSVIFGREKNEILSPKKIKEGWIIAGVVLGILIGLVIWLNSSFLIMH